MASSFGGLLETNSDSVEKYLFPTTGAKLVSKGDNALLNVDAATGAGLEASWVDVPPATGGVEMAPATGAVLRAGGDELALATGGVDEPPVIGAVLGVGMDDTTPAIGAILGLGEIDTPPESGDVDATPITGEEGEPAISPKEGAAETDDELTSKGAEVTETPDKEGGTVVEGVT